MGFPKRKRKGHGREACRFTTGTIRVEPDRHHVTLPRLGRLRTHESTRKLERRLEQGTARILSATLSRRGNRWYVSFGCEVHKAVRNPRRPQARVGVDVGIRHLAVLSDGRRIPNPAPLQAALRDLSERSYRCERCGLVLDHDENAARDLAALLRSGAEMEVVAGSGPETRNARGVDVRPGLAGQAAVNREAGTGHRPGEAGTVGAQAPAARTVSTRR